MQYTISRNKNVIITITLLIGLLLLNTSSLFSADYYVSPTGNNGNSGSQASPWLTIQYAVDNVAAGDNIYVRSGTYTEQIELFEIAGASATDTIIFQSESGDSSDVTLTYDAQSAGEDYIVKLTGTDYITFKNLTIPTIIK